VSSVGTEGAAGGIKEGENTMSYHVVHSTGEMESGYPMDRFSVLLDELLTSDDEHPDVAVGYESEWTLTISRSGVLILENLEEGEPMHLGPPGRAATLEIMAAVAEGRLDDVRSRPWLVGYPARRAR
jgi:hypothetical protein